MLIKIKIIYKFVAFIENFMGKFQHKLVLGLFFTLFCFSPLVSQAQVLKLAGEHFGQLNIGPGFFSSDLGRDGVFQFYNPRIAVGFNYSYRFHERWAVQLSATYGFYGEKDGNWRPRRGWEVSTHLVDAALSAKFYILKRGTKGDNQGRPDLYVAAGFGGLASIQPTLTQSNEEGTTKMPESGVTKQEFIDEWNTNHNGKNQRVVSKKEDPKAPIVLDQSNKEYLDSHKEFWFKQSGDKKYLLVPSFPISIGALWSIKDRLLLGFDYTFRVAISDYLDGLNPVGSWYPDMYSSVNFSVGFVLNKECYICNSSLSERRFKKYKASSGYWF